ncbi:MAG TPA: NAD(P)-dependent oxidoreductase [Anaerolineaceae bacterium]
MVLRILNLEPENYSAEARGILETLGKVADGPFTRTTLLESLPNYDVLIVRLAHQIDREVLTFASRLKAIVSATTGLDHIDEEYAAQRGIVVLSLHGEIDFLRSIPATAEHTWGLLLALVRSLPYAYQSVLAGEWDRDRFRGHDLAGKTLGIIGLGRIGEKVARYGQAFGMRIVAYDPFCNDWMRGVEHTAHLEDVFSQANALSIHVPLGPSTVWLVSKPLLDLLPEGAVLINTARGEVVDEDALLDSLRSGRLAGAALDVIWGERRTDWNESPLLDYARSHTNLLITPHIGGATVESMAATEIFMARRLAQFLTEEGLLRKQD